MRTIENPAQTNIDNVENKPDTRPKHTDPNKVYKLLKAGFSVKEIAKQENVSNQAIYQLMERHDIQPNRASNFKEVEADLLADKRSIILNHIGPTTLKKIVDKHPALIPAIYGTFYDKERLERGQATEITVNTSLIADINKLINSLEGINTLKSKDNEVVVEVIEDEE